MDGTTYRQQRKRVNDLVAFWKPVLGLRDWHIVVRFYRDGPQFSQDTSYDAVN